MRYSLLLFILCIFQISKAEILIQNCKPESLNDPVIFSDDFKWNYNLVDLRSTFDVMYKSEKRLKKRAFLNEKDEIVLPYDQDRGGPIVISKKFIEQISAHIEQGFEQKIIDAVFFPDMGHSHFFIPQKKFDQVYSKFEPKEYSTLYRKLFADSELKILYHTAEQVQFRTEDGELIQDLEVIHRYQTRNLVGPNTNKPIFTIQKPESPANTARDLPGHFYWGAGFNISANHQGCFSYRKGGQTFFFDLSMYDLESSGSGEF